MDMPRKPTIFISAVSRESRWKTWAAVVLLTLPFPLLRAGDTSPNPPSELRHLDEKHLLALRALPKTFAAQSGKGEESDEKARLARTLAALEKKYGVPAGTFEHDMPFLADEVLTRADTSASDRASARFLMDIWSHDPVRVREFEGWKAEKRVQYPSALEHFRAAAALTDRERDPKEWARVQHAIAFILDKQGQFAETEKVLREAIAVRERVLGAEHPDTLKSRNSLAGALFGQGKYPEAEKLYREVAAIDARVLGAEYRETLTSRNNLAETLRLEGRYADAEKENREILAIRERLLGAEHPDTLLSRYNLGSALYGLRRYAEAEKEQRAVLAVRERTLGADHPDTLASRNGVAAVLETEGKPAEAEKEYRAALAGYERVFGPEHPYVFMFCYNLAKCLVRENRFKEALELAKRAEKGSKRTLGEDHPQSKAAAGLRKVIEAALGGK